MHDSRAHCLGSLEHILIPFELNLFELVWRAMKNSDQRYHGVGPFKGGDEGVIDVGGGDVNRDRGA